MSDGNPKKLPNVAIVSVTYNRCEPLLVLLDQLHQLNYPKDEYDIFLVDNDSQDDTVSRVRADFREVSLILSHENTGTSAGFNMGICHALDAPKDYKYIWLLDSDVEVTTDTLNPLITAMEENENIGIIGSSVYDPRMRDRIVSSGLRVNWDNGSVSLNKNINSQGGDLIEADLIPACSLLVRKTICLKLGLWDEKYWVYWGDTDWCQRILKEGYKIYSSVKSRAWHRDWANTYRNFNAPSVLYDDFRGALLFNIRHNPDKSLAGARHLIVKNYFKGALEYFTMRPNFPSAFVAATEDFLKASFPRSNYYKGPRPLTVSPVHDLIHSLRDEHCVVIKTVLLHADNTALVDRVKSVLKDVYPEVSFDTVRQNTPRQRDDFVVDYRYYLKMEVPEVIRRLFLPRRDLYVCNLATPHLYTFLMARKVLMLDEVGNGLVLERRISRSISGFLGMILKGIMCAYIRLPVALRRNKSLQDALVNDRSRDMSTCVELTARKS